MRGIIIGIPFAIVLWFFICQGIVEAIKWIVL
jgi:archaellum biogenesis protein FlaJ (TadC family)